MKMKKQAVQLGVALALLLFVVGVFLFLQRVEPAPEEEPLPPDIYVLGGTEQPFVKWVDIENDTGAYRIENQARDMEEQIGGDTGYTITGLDADSLNQPMLKAVMTASANLPAKKVVAESGADLATYGLQAPRATLRIAYGEGEALLQIGDDAPGSEGTYVSLGDGTVYLVSSGQLSGALGSRLDFVSRTLTPGNNESTQFQQVVLSGEKFPEALTIREQTDSDLALPTGTSTYVITTPVQANADFGTGITSLKSVYGISASEVVAVAAFLSEESAAYGLGEEPYLRVDVTTLNEEEDPNPVAPFSVAFSPPDEEGNVFAQYSGTDYVYQVPAASLPFLGLDLFDYREKLIVLPHIDSVAEIEVVADGEAYLFSLMGEGDELIVSANDSVLDTKNFRQFYQNLVGARYEEEVLSAPAEPDGDGESAADLAGISGQPEGEPVLRFTYRYRDGSPENTVRFWPAAARRAYVALDDGAVYLTKSVYVDKITEDAARMAADQEITGYVG